MTWDGTRDIYLDVDRPGGANPLLDGKNSAAGESPCFVESDKFLLRIWFRTKGVTGAASTAVELVAGAGIVFAAKLKTALSATTPLFSADSFAQVGADDDLHYEATLDLSQPALRAAIGAAESITVRVDVEVQSAGDLLRNTYQFDATVYHQVYDGESAPAAIPAWAQWVRVDGAWVLRLTDPDGMPHADL